MSILSLLLTIILDMGTFICCDVSLSALKNSMSLKLERRSNLENVSSHYDQIVVANTCLENLGNIYQHMGSHPNCLHLAYPSRTVQQREGTGLF